MHNVYGDLFEQIGVDAICITTNGYVKKDGRAVMARGNAFQAVGMWPEIDKELGDAIKAYGNVPTVLLSLKNMHYDVLSFPVKPRSVICSETKDNILKHKRRRHKVGSEAPGWASVANTDLIKESAINLVKLANKMDYKKVVIPRPGCGAGELSWEDVEPIISNIFDDRFYSITYPPKYKTPVW